MGVSLSKGGNVSLSKEAPTMKNVLIGLGWDARSTDGQDFDLDASAFLLTSAGKVRGDADFIFYNNLKSTDGSVLHTGDNRTGEGDGDDEVITVDLTRLPAQVEYLAFTVNSFRGQTFNEVDNAFCRVVDQSRKELARYQLTEQGSHTGIIIASLSRNNGEWDFTAHGKASTGRTIDDMHSDIVATVVR